MLDGMLQASLQRDSKCEQGARLIAGPQHSGKLLRQLLQLCIAHCNFGAPLDLRIPAGRTLVRPVELAMDRHHSACAEPHTDQGSLVLNVATGSIIRLSSERLRSIYDKAAESAQCSTAKTWPGMRLQ